MIEKELINTLYHLLTFIVFTVTILYGLSSWKMFRKFVFEGKFPKKGVILIILIGGLADILASEYGILIIGATANIRDCIAIFSGILGGPIAGIGVGLIGGLYRITGLVWKGFTGTLGYWTALGCGLATIGAGLIGAWLSKYKGVKINTLTPKRIWQIAGITGLWEVIHLQVIVPLISPLYTDYTFWQAETLMFKKILLPMIIVNVVGVLFFLYITRDAARRREMELAEEELRKAEKEFKELEGK